LPSSSGSDGVAQVGLHGDGQLHPRGAVVPGERLAAGEVGLLHARSPMRVIDPPTVVPIASNFADL
jgi:hypothetical protein